MQSTDSKATHKVNGKTKTQKAQSSNMSNTNIMTFGYKPKLEFNGSISKIDRLATYLLERLITRWIRPNTPQNRIVLICHSQEGEILSCF